MEIFLICPVRKVTKKEKALIDKYVSDLEARGHKVHWPERDTHQDDPVGLRICTDNCAALKKAKQVHVWWNGKSIGSFFDFGMAFALDKEIVLANPKSVKFTPQKSFESVLLTLHNHYRLGVLLDRIKDFSR